MKVYHFEKFKDFFEFQLGNSKSGRFSQRKTTLQELAHRMGYASPSLLSMVASGQRLPSDALLIALFREWNIPVKEQERIRLAVEIEKRKRKGLSHIQLIEELNRISPQRAYKQIEVSQYKIIKDWFVLVIKLLAKTPNFNPDPIVISKRLRNKITPTEARNALKDLLEANQLRVDNLTGKYFVTTDATETSHEIPSEAIRANHKGMLQRAIEAIEEQKVSERHFNSIALQFNPADTVKAKERILTFIKDFDTEFCCDQSESIYQLNLQFFEHTKKENSNEN